MSKKPTVIERKLGRENAFGQAHQEDNIIEIDPRQGGKRYLRTIIHEHFHLLFPAMSETEVDKKSSKVANLLWKHNYRKVINK
jgi:hypothetical protein